VDEVLRQKFAALAPLDPRNHYAKQFRCKVCDGTSTWFDHVDFNKYCNDINPYRFGRAGIPVEYLRCERCGLIYTQFFDDWTEADWREYVYNEDYIKVDADYSEVRPTHVANDFARRLRGAERARILDYGSGAGVFVARMRENGFADIACYDPFSSPQRPEGRFDIITCFEVIEHSPDPLMTLRDMIGLMAEGGCILFSQTVQPDDILSRRGGWWYLGPRNGHVSTYAEETLVVMGRMLGLQFYRGDTVFGYAGRSLSAAAQLALRSIGPSFSVARLFAPSTLPDSAIAFPAPRDIWWHKVESDEVTRFRWTGPARAAWRVKWQDVARLQVRVPYVAETQPDFAAGCSLTLDGVAQPTRLSRNEVTAEFDVEGRTHGTVQLHTPEPIDDLLLQRKTGLAVPLEPEPTWGPTC
jgi:2-polyprenyl-6-hydroxyphenyl methylase/3-demethylubiquinone-9 3-methyltransferase